jgi:hypothetical protein
MTEKALIRLAVARELARECPKTFAQEIAVTGSVARGVADAWSDLELTFWAASPPHRAEVETWLRGLGVEQLANGGVTDLDGSEWTTGGWHGVWVEFGFGAIENVSEAVKHVVAGENLTQASLQFGSTITSALPVRTSGQLAHWQEALRHYPDNVRARVIAANTQVWADPHVPGVRWALAARGARPALAQRLIWDMNNLLAVLFAVNRRWEPDHKWTDAAALDLPISPPDLSARLNEVFTLTDPVRSIDTMFTLILETLSLVPSEYDVSAARASIMAGLPGSR